MKSIARRVITGAGSSLWEGTTKFTDTGGGATDVVVIRHSNGEMVCSSFHAQLPKLSKMDMLGCSVQLFVNNLPTGLCMVLDRENICCFEDGGYRPSSVELEGLRLKPGRNSLRYELVHPCNNDRRYSVKADLHLWKPHDKVVVVDIDGTVTKTDVAGYGAAKLGYEYIHMGVCELVTAIARQGYRILFLTSRAITLAQSTREFLRSIGFANGGSGMPEFCLITTTETFLPSLMVGVRSADKFKTAALQELVSAFVPEIKLSSQSMVKIPGWRMDTSPQMSSDHRGVAKQRAVVEVEDELASETSTVAAKEESEEEVHAKQQQVAADAQGAIMRDPGKVFVCGFGNRLTDTAAYAAVGVPPERNFLIDERSHLRTAAAGTNAMFDGYLNLLPHIDRMLPRLNAHGEPVQAPEGKGTCPFDCDCDLLVL
mmetsp:Transcript_13470/g.32941  ORF Transcript_13470/g.32941 Transcript_13470/m.32941 type:complete len:428 (+) Transcript_13470:355-1638(+)